MRIACYLLLLALSGVWFSVLAQTGGPAEEARLLRFPTIHGDQIVFSYAGDLYTVARSGGTARRLTSDNGYEMFAKFSPDGKTLAFTGQYDGNTEVYAMPAAGGTPRRLTHTATLGRDELSDRMGPNNIVMAWKPDGKTVVYRSRRHSFNAFKGALYQVAIDDPGMDEQLPFSVASWCSYSHDGQRLAYNRVFREFRTWKYYRGGMADDIYIHDFRSGKSENITNNSAQDIFPMWRGNKIYFASDRNMTMNIFAYDLGTRQTTQITNFTDYDVKFPSLGGDAIVFEQAGYLHILDLNTNRTTKVSVRIENDLPFGRPELVDASKQIFDARLAPDGERVLFSARGDVYSVPSESGVTRNLTRSDSVHDREARWSPDGKWVAWISDQSGEDELYVGKSDGSAPPTQLTRDSDNYKFSFAWSPDGKKLLWSDKMLRLRYVDIDSKKITEVAQAEAWEIRSFDWSPDSKWIAYQQPEWQTSSRVMLYSLESKKTTPVTDRWYDSGAPAFSPDGKFLYFVSSRDFNPIYSSSEWNHAYKDMSKIYFVALAKDTENPLRPENDEVNLEDETPEDEKAELMKKMKRPEVKEMKVDLDGLADRVEVLPVEASNYYNLQPWVGSIYYAERSYTEDKSELKRFDLDDEEETVLGHYNSFQLSHNGRKMLLAHEKHYYVADVSPKTKSIETKTAVDVSAMKTRVRKDKEWAQIYNETWRQMRDFFYAPNMHGADWEAMREKYAPLAAAARHRADLSYVIGELIGELNVGHAYIGQGDLPEVEKIKMGLLGARFERHGSGFYQVKKILNGENWRGDLRSPLTEMGVDVKEGDYILAVNGRSLKEVENLYELLVNTAGKQTELVVNDRPDMSGARKEIVLPLDDESSLYYFNWVRENIRKVNEGTDGKVGYIHVPDMGPAGLNEFVKHFYPQLDKKGLIIDVRGNGGGNVSPMLIERLRREMDMVTMSRNTKPGTSPRQMMYGPKVALCDQYTASDGDLFSYRFKKYELGTLIGVRSWGGTVGIRGSLPLIDGADLRKPEFSRYSLDGKKWIIEGHGVDPDIVVVNDPAEEFKGKDAQLEKAVEVINQQIERYGKEIPPIPDYPERSK